MTEVYRFDGDGKKVHSVGFFKDATVAEAFRRVHPYVDWHKIAPAHVLTNGVIGYHIADTEPVTLFNDEEIAVIRKKILAKISPEERAVLGFAEEN
jgi:hypothetical protein